MKRCPECRRDYYDDTLLYCLDDGNALLEGPASADEPATAILSEPPALAGSGQSSESATRPQVHTTAAEAEPQNHLGRSSERPSLSAHRAAEPQESVDTTGRRRFDKQLLLAPLALAVIVLGGFFAYKYFSPTDQITSIAVLPFENASDNADLDYLSDGVSESVIDRLSQLPQLKVIARSSSFRYRDQNLNLQEIANALGVDAIVTGRVVPRGDNYQIRVELVDVRENKQLWSENFTRKASDVQILQTEISREIAENLRTRLSGTQVQQLASQNTNDPRAYEMLLKGRFYKNKSGLPEDYHKAVENYEQAVAVDPRYALAWAELSESYSFGGGRGLSRDDRRLKQEAAAQKALEIDPNLAEGHFALANIKRSAWEWAEAEREHLRSIELNPRLSGPRGAYAAHLSYLKRFDEAFDQIRHRNELDPLSPIGSTVSGDVYYRARRYDDAIRFYNRLLDLTPASPIPHQRLGDVYSAQGKYPEAIAEYEKALNLRSGIENTRIEGLLGAVYAKAGMRDKAEAILQTMKADGENAQHTVMAGLYAALGKNDEAVAYLEKAFALRVAGLQRIGVDPHFDNLRADPRFKDLLKRMNLPE